MFSLPVKKAYVQKLMQGYPWCFQRFIDTFRYPPSGSLVYLINPQKKPFAIAYFNEKPHLMARILTLNPKTDINEAFFYHRFEQARQKREKHFSVPYYRLVHAEGDALPGLIIDRFGDTLVVQINTLGMAELKALWLPALTRCLKPADIIFRNDSPLRLLEGLPIEQNTPTPSTQRDKVLENGVQFCAHLHSGQKTGWFYDQRANRKWVAEQAQGKSVLDLYTFSGGFGITAAVHGASDVTLVDSSAASLDLAAETAKQMHVSSICTFTKAKVFDLLPELIAAQKQFDIVVVDPPAFVKQSQDKAAGLRGYQKLAKLSAQLVKKNGILFLASCSHHAPPDALKACILAGMAEANRQGEQLYYGEQDVDHPAHPLLPENRYLKAFAFRLD